MCTSSTAQQYLSQSPPSDNNKTQDMMMMMIMGRSEKETPIPNFIIFLQKMINQMISSFRLNFIVMSFSNRGCSWFLFPCRGLFITQYYAIQSTCPADRYLYDYEWRYNAIVLENLTNYLFNIIIIFLQRALFSGGECKCTKNKSTPTQALHSIITHKERTTSI